MGEFSEDITIQSIVIGDRMVEVSYAEQRDQSDHVMQVRTLAIEWAIVDEEFSELMDAAKALVDAALLVHRSPRAPTAPRGKLVE